MFNLLSCCYLLAKLNGRNIPAPVAEDVNKSDDMRQVLKIYGKNNNAIFRMKKKVSVTKRQTHPVVIIRKTREPCLLLKTSETQALIQSPLRDVPEVISVHELEEEWTGTVISLKSTSHFDIKWFVPAFLKHRNLLTEVLVLSLIIQFMGLITPLFFQVVMDKVLANHALSTLDVLVFVLVIAGGFEITMKALREYLLSHTTSRIDIMLGMKVFRHVLALPLPWFKNRNTGTIISRILELDTVREFLTGSSMTLFVDMCFTIIFFLVMFTISPLLTAILLLFMPFYVLLALGGQRSLTERTEQQFRTGALNTAFLNETVSGAETVKSLAMEPVMSGRWETQTADMTEATYRLQSFSTLMNQGVMLLQRLSTVIIIWCGAHQVMNLHMTTGQLIAFNMLAGQVQLPFSRFTEFWQKYIQTRVAVDKLGDMLNQPTENVGDAADVKAPVSLGDITLRDITFRYRPDLPPVLNDLSLHIPAGRHIGIVGPSGSGKSTLARLIQKLYIPDSGDIFFGQQPLSHFAPDMLRSQMGVVLQENYLFSLSVRQNIAIRQPTASLDDVIAAAKLSGAHDFILQLPLGYDTVISEGGKSLSGGQRQRIAIARALLSGPEVLIFDEATSALDEESQSVIQQNMKEICRNRTVITIAHRLSTIRHCDTIIVMENGKVSQTGSHEQLREQKGCYSRLWALQQSMQSE
ncbi:peptidase domain-containing ABC transporter [Enterobacter roggenkampii]|uniref:peptidase domain-containing ABC transporter n=1 Tax=Enterobacter roggenkampii TaxID=1812935 RepID=UPI002DB88145|nr:type I secretion system permease/ATPase [Enterobacter roggenkampii]MEB5887485.1 type I secretion system permease/ATPase [Enterobacter roggenkampii]